jgi:uncharacterized protein YecE (DUF72 family)
MRYFVGTSGYAYREWLGTFYPPKLPAGEMLDFYAQHFASVEINNTFYRLPEKDTFQDWTRAVPADFQFAIKAPQAITHRKRLKNVRTETDELLERMSLLGKRCGPLLVQLPPNMKADVSRLDDFLAIVDRRVKVAVEFRHPSWFVDPVFACLRRHKAAHCLADAEELPKQELTATTDWGYVRLRRAKYTRPTLARWVARIEAQPWRRAYVFFKHEETGTGPKFAARFLELCGSPRAG